ncbi:ankyrin repeat domain-containing protein [Aurantibacter crassamenti]|uniref:ankyrin repeat domain-containing protein n=1 Tax=Aurantibacter crassamenti TaxID=1837375 RepID=UPI00193A0E52|nr:ankyrin repeat domain-containing protein [Aurantibacter crassamenti]MBM1105681.1 ankyrin repeat domain-containing protein [Aurantibacter crassamenti]
MKTLRIKVSKLWVFTSAMSLIFCVACGQTNKKLKGDEAIVHNNAAVDKPFIDFQTAILSDDLESVKQHIAYGTDLDQRDAMSGSTPLITAASFGKSKIAQELIAAGADLHAKNNDGATALHTAAFFCRIEIVQLLIDAKVDKSIKNNFGQTARESVMSSFTEIKPVYEMLKQQLQPIGLQIDLNEIEKARPVVAMMLQ